MLRLYNVDGRELYMQFTQFSWDLKFLSNLHVNILKVNCFNIPIQKSTAWAQVIHLIYDEILAVNILFPEHLILNIISRTMLFRPDGVVLLQGFDPLVVSLFRCPPFLHPGIIVLLIY